MKVVAHRGACTEDIENSWGAFEKAISCNADRIELDVHLTKDKQLVVMHDHNFLRTCRSNETISETTRSFIESNIRLTNGEKVPFLDEVLERHLDQIEFNIEIKDSDPSVIRTIAELVRKQKSPGKIIISSFYIPICESLARDYPDLKIALLWERSLWWPGAFSYGPGKILQKNNIRIFHPDVRLVTQNLVSKIHENGWQIVPYVGLSKETEAESLWSFLMALNVDGFCTNYPRKLNLWLKEAQDDSRRFNGISPVGTSTH